MDSISNLSFDDKQVYSLIDKKYTYTSDSSNNMISSVKSPIPPKKKKEINIYNP